MQQDRAPRRGVIALGLTGMARGFEDQRRSPDIAARSFEERLCLLVDREAADRENRRMTTPLKHAALRHNASIEDVEAPALDLRGQVTIRLSYANAPRPVR